VETDERDSSYKKIIADQALLIHVAKTNKNAAVRREAIRWLGQTQDPRSLQFLEEILLGSKAN
jgi:HEAT repeat protein